MEQKFEIEIKYDREVTHSEDEIKSIVEEALFYCLGSVSVKEIK